jgi:hypothetical protein
MLIPSAKLYKRILESDLLEEFCPSETLFKTSGRLDSCRSSIDEKVKTTGRNNGWRFLLRLVRVHRELIDSARCQAARAPSDWTFQRQGSCQQLLSADLFPSTTLEIFPRHADLVPAIFASPPRWMPAVQRFRRYCVRQARH